MSLAVRSCASRVTINVSFYASFLKRNIISQSEFLIRQVLFGVKDLNEVADPLEQGGADIAWEALWMREAKIGTDKETLFSCRQSLHILAVLAEDAILQ